VALAPRDSAALETLVFAAVAKARHDDIPLTPPGLYDKAPVTTARDDAHDHDVADAAAVVYASVRAGDDAPWLLQGCTTLMMAMHQLAPAHDCTSRALARGVDSTWHLLRLTALAFEHGDTLAGRLLFNAAAHAAHTPADRAQIGWHLQARYLSGETQPSSNATERARQMSQWAADAKERQLWLALPDSQLVPWLRARVATLDGARLWDARDSTLGDHFRAVVVDADRFFLCRPSDRVPPCMEDEPRVLETVQARRYRLWNTATGAPMMVMPYAIDVDRRDTAKTGNIEVRQSGGEDVVDTSFVVDLAGGRGHTTGIVVGRAPSTGESWNIVARFGSAARLAGAYGDGQAAIGGSVGLSDLVLSAGVDTVSARVGSRVVIMTPFAPFARSEPLHLYCQLRSASPRTGFTSTTAIYQVDKFGHRGKALIAIRAPVDIRAAGIQDIDRVLDASRLAAGSYELDVQILNAAGTAVAARFVPFRLR
jgi:hypothetical protein